MKMVLQIISYVALGLTIVPPVLFLAGTDKFDLDMVKLLMLIATIVWFVTTPFWMNRKENT